MELLRTPDERFERLPGFAFAPRYSTVDGVRIHHLDEGPRDARPVLLMHGEPSWCFLYRKMIPVLVAAGHRVVAPDLVGFGRSDKPALRSDYTCERHVAWMSGWLRGLDLRDVTLVCQDWGGLIGLRLVAAHPERFARVVAANTGLPTGSEKLPEAFHAWRQFSQETPVFNVGKIVSGGCAERLPPEVVAAYDAPFPEERFKEGARQFPMLVPASPDDPSAAPNRAAWEVLSKFEKPFLTAFSDKDAITRGVDAILQEKIPGARGQKHTTILGGGHFLQEDRGEELARVVVKFMAPS
jgi:haloalkane dehalogenase